MKVVVEALYIPAKPRGDDPLSQRGHLAIKFSGGVSQDVLEGDTNGAHFKLREGLIQQLDQALTKAIQTPDTVISG